MDNRRKFKNYILNRSMQGRMAIYFLIIAFLTAIPFLVGGIFANRAIMRFLMGSRLSSEMLLALSEMMSVYSYLLITGVLTMLVAAVALSVFVSHRFAGPVVALCAMIEEIKNGNLDYDRKLRDGDELTEIQTKLEELRGALKNKK